MYKISGLAISTVTVELGILNENTEVLELYRAVMHRFEIKADLDREYEEYCISILHDLSAAVVNKVKVKLISNGTEGLTIQCIDLPEHKIVLHTGDWTEL